MVRCFGGCHYGEAAFLECVQKRGDCFAQVERLPKLPRSASLLCPWEVAVEKWFRIPTSLFVELEGLRTSSEYVLGCLPQQLKEFHRKSKRPWTADQINEIYDIYNAGRWFYERLSDWSKSLPKGSASPHVFRKTALQFARQGQDATSLVANDAAVTEAVMMTHYVEEGADQFLHRSNRMYARIIAGVPMDVLNRYGYMETEAERLRAELYKAVEQQDWKKAGEITAKLEELRKAS